MSEAAQSAQPTGEGAREGTPTATSHPANVDEREILVAVRDVRKQFRTRHGVVHAVDGVDLDIPTGATLALVGESGSGKTTLGRCVLGLTRWDAGTIEVGGRSLPRLRGDERRAFRHQAQMVFQDPYASLNPRMRVGQMLDEPLRMHGRSSRAARRARIATVLEQVQLAPDYAKRFPGELSGGEQQRVGIARAVISEPRLIVLDEPTAALDAAVRKGIYKLLAELQVRMGLTYLLISHDLASVWDVSDAVAVMHRGRLVEVGSRDDVFLSPRHPYTVALMSAAPLVRAERPERHERLVLHGEEDFSGDDLCRFAGRCPLAQDVCRNRRPGLGEIAPRHLVACWRADEVPAKLGRFGEGWRTLHSSTATVDPSRDEQRGER